jgi:hypothetical protein
MAVTRECHAVTILPPDCFTEPSSRYGPATSKPFSSLNSRIAASQRLLGFLVFPLRNRPDTKVFLCPDRSAGMNEEDLQSTIMNAIHDETGASLYHT